MSITFKSATGSFSYDKTLDGRFLEWVHARFFTDPRDELIKKYINKNKITELIIDSIDSVNKNMPKNIYWKII